MTSPHTGDEPSRSRKKPSFFQASGSSELRFNLMAVVKSKLSAYESDQQTAAFTRLRATVRPPKRFESGNILQTANFDSEACCKNVLKKVAKKDSYAALKKNPTFPRLVNFQMNSSVDPSQCT